MAEEDEAKDGNPTAGWKERVENQWRRIREDAETYPYVWGSYILVYGGFGGYMMWRLRKLRRTEDRVRVLQERLWKLVAEEESAAAGPGRANSSTSPAPRQPPPVDKSGK